MSFENKIKLRFQKLIEEKSTEIQRSNSAKLEAVKIKLRRMLEIEKILSIIITIVNEDLAPKNKILKTQGNTQHLLDTIDGLNPNDPEMKIPNEDLKIGIGLLNAKSINSKAYARAVVGLQLLTDKVSASINDNVMWNEDYANITNDMVEEIVYQMIKDAKW